MNVANETTEDRAKSLFPYFGSEFVAVFNCNATDQRKGRDAVLSRYGKRGWAKVKNINKTGIMAMYKVKDIPETRLYSLVVGTSSDGRRMKIRNRSNGDGK